MKDHNESRLPMKIKGFIAVMWEFIRSVFHISHSSGREEIEGSKQELAHLSNNIERLTTLLEKQLNDKEEAAWSENLSSLAGNYVQLCGTLAGFSGAFILALLSPGLFPQGTSEVSIVLLLCAAFGYTYAAAWCVLAPTLPAHIKLKRIQLSDKVFLGSNLLLWISFSIVLFSLGFRWSLAASLVLLVLAFLSPTWLLPE
jgi:hypothetical protein